MEADTIHSLVEKEGKQSGKGVFEVPRDWLTVVRHISARKKLVITQMVSSDFKNSKLLFEGPLGNRQEVGWTKMRRFLGNSSWRIHVCVVTSGR